MCQFCVTVRNSVKQLTTRKLLEKSLKSGTVKPITDRRISLQAALIAVPSSCPTDTGILWKRYIYMLVCGCVCLCVYTYMYIYVYTIHIYVYMKGCGFIWLSLLPSLVAGLFVEYLIYRIISDYRYCIVLYLNDLKTRILILQKHLTLCLEYIKLHNQSENSWTLLWQCRFK